MSSAFVRAARASMLEGCQTVLGRPSSCRWMEVVPTGLMLCMRKGKISDIERNVRVSEPVKAVGSFFHKQDERSVGDSHIVMKLNDLLLI